MFRNHCRFTYNGWFYIIVHMQDKRWWTLHEWKGLFFTFVKNISFLDEIRKKQKSLYYCLIFIYSILVIPIDDLPERQVGYGFGLVDKENVPKPAYLKVFTNYFYKMHLWHTHICTKLFSGHQTDHYGKQTQIYCSWRSKAAHQGRVWPCERPTILRV